ETLSEGTVSLSITIGPLKRQVGFILTSLTGMRKRVILGADLLLKLECYSIDLKEGQLKLASCSVPLVAMTNVDSVVQSVSSAVAGEYRISAARASGKVRKRYKLGTEAFEVRVARTMLIPGGAVFTVAAIFPVEGEYARVVPAMNAVNTVMTCVREKR